MATKSRTKPRKPRKPASAVKRETVRLRLAESLKSLAIAAAEEDGRDISSWLRWLIVRRARELSLVPDDAISDEGG